MDQRHPLADSTLAELREIVLAARDMPAGSVVRVRTRFGASSDGALLKRVLIIAPDPALPVGFEEPSGESPSHLFEPSTRDASAR